MYDCKNWNNTTRGAFAELVSGMKGADANEFVGARAMMDWKGSQPTSWMLDLCAFLIHNVY